MISKSEACNKILKMEGRGESTADKVFALHLIVGPIVVEKSFCFYLCSLFFIIYGAYPAVFKDYSYTFAQRLFLVQDSTTGIWKKNASLEWLANTQQKHK